MKTMISTQAAHETSPITLDRDALVTVTGGDAAHDAAVAAGNAGRVLRNGLASLGNAIAHSRVVRDSQDTARRVAQSANAFARGDLRGTAKGALAAAIDGAQTIGHVLFPGLP